MRLIAATLLAAPAIALAQFKCTGPDGKISFQQMPCAAGGKQQDLVLKGSAPNAEVARMTAGAASAAPKDRGTVEQRMVKQLESDRRVREVEQEISQTESNIAGRNAAMTGELDALRNRKRLASNNLAGATFEQSISTEMQAVAAKYKAMNDVDLERLRQLREDLALARQDAVKH